MLPQIALGPEECASRRPAFHSRNVRQDVVAQSKTEDPGWHDLSHHYGLEAILGRPVNACRLSYAGHNLETSTIATTCRLHPLFTIMADGALPRSLTSAPSVLIEWDLAPTWLVLAGDVIHRLGEA